MKLPRIHRFFISNGSYKFEFSSKMKTIILMNFLKFVKSRQEYIEIDTPVVKELSGQVAESAGRTAQTQANASGTYQGSSPTGSTPQETETQENQGQEKTKNKKNWIYLRLYATKKDEYKQMYYTFLDYCMIHFEPHSNFDKRVVGTKLSEIYSISDEAFAMLLVENMVDDLLLVHDQKKLLEKKQYVSRYTKSDKNNSTVKQKGWNQKGVNRYNTIYRRMQKLRSAAGSMAELEQDVMTYYKVMSGWTLNDKGEYELNTEDGDVDSSSDTVKYDIIEDAIDVSLKLIE